MPSFTSEFNAVQGSLNSNVGGDGDSDVPDPNTPTNGPGYEPGATPAPRSFTMPAELRGLGNGISRGPFLIGRSCPDSESKVRIGLQHYSVIVVTGLPKTRRPERE